MQYGLGHLSIIPVRETADPISKMVSQVLYGEVFKIKEERKNFSRIQLFFDGFEGWVRNSQINKISEENYSMLTSSSDCLFNTDFLSYVTTEKNQLLPVVIGSRLDSCTFLGHQCDEMVNNGNAWSKSQLVETALLYLNSPFLSGGKTPFGIDSSGFAQMVYKINGQRLLRTTQEQSTQGEALSFIEESEPGDLAFFDNSDGTINHVGIILKDNHIIHSSGHVRIDRLDHTGIFNTDQRVYSHNLRVIKKVV